MLLKSINPSIKLEWLYFTNCIKLLGLILLLLYEGLIAGKPFFSFNCIAPVHILWISLWPLVALPPQFLTSLLISYRLRGQIAATWSCNHAICVQQINRHPKLCRCYWQTNTHWRYHSLFLFLFLLVDIEDPWLSFAISATCVLPWTT